MEELEILEETFAPEPGQTLEDFLKKVRGRAG